MFQLSSVNPVLIRSIKIISPILMMSAIALDLVIVYQWNHGDSISRGLKALGAIGTVAMTAHLLEGIVASMIAYKQGLNLIKFGVYTFLVGTVAFLDLLDSD